MDDLEGFAEKTKTGNEGSIPSSKSSQVPPQGSDYRRVGNYLKACGRIFHHLGDRIDRHGPMMTTLSTVAIAILTAVYVHWSHKQWAVMNDQLSVMRGSGTQTDQLIGLYQQQVAIAEAANQETHNILTATQAAVFQCSTEYERNIASPISGSTGIPSIDVSFINVGKSAARKFSGEIKFVRRNKDGKLIQSLRHTSSDDTVVPGSTAYAQFPVIPASSDYMDYASETFVITTKISYDDGFNEGRTQKFCREMAVTQKRGPVWTECGEAKSWETIIK